jgi:autotransporter-associated beta strand protein
VPTNIAPLFIVIALAVAGVQSLHADDATWDLNPVSNDWNTAQNWTPETVPNSTTAVATFGASNTTTVLCQASGDGYASTLVGEMDFAPGASAYTITATPDPNVFIYPTTIEFYGAGIVNNSGVTQNFVAAHSGTTQESGRIYFMDSSTAGDNVVITNEGGASGGDGIYGGFTNIGYNFSDRASAGNATFINEGGEVSGARGGTTLIGGYSYSGAESATFVNEAGEVSGANAAYTLIQTFGNIGSSTFICNPATVTGAEGGWTEIDFGTASGAKFIANGAASAGPQGGQVYVYGGTGYATFIGNGGTGSGAEGGLIDLFALPASDQAVVIAKGGRNGGLGGHILIEGRDPPMDLGQFRVFGNGLLDLTNLRNGVTIGSLAGDGMVFPDDQRLTIGGNNLSTIFSGVIQAPGSVTKVGTGTLTLAGANTYTGFTTVTAGTLKVTNQSGSATGTGAVQVTAGTLGGSGIIEGNVTIGDGSADPAFLEPSVGSNRLATLAIQRALTFKADGTYSYQLNTRNPSADQVIANGVTIESGAQFAFQALGNRRLPIGTVFTAISNTSVNPINGTFANLPDGSTFTAGRNNYQVSYEGGDGNDLTLTVVP